MKELIKLKMPNYDSRMKLIQALNESGYGTRIEESKEKPHFLSVDYFVIIYGKEKL